MSTTLQRQPGGGYLVLKDGQAKVSVQKADDGRWRVHPVVVAPAAKDTKS